MSFSFSIGDFLLVVGLKALGLVGVGIAGSLLARNASAAQRHVIWLGVLTGLAALPLFEWGMPAWRGPVWQNVAVVAASVLPPPVPIQGDVYKLLMGTAETPMTPSVAGPTWDKIIGVFFLLGMLGQVVRIFGALHVWRTRVRRARSERPIVEGDAMPPAFYSSEVEAPVVVGWWRPVILLPRAMRGWPRHQRRAVLFHESAHVERGDHRWIPVLLLVKVFYWWHPAVWLVLRRLCAERERACDDAVLRRGVPASAYARTLTRVIRRAGNFPTAPGFVLAMAGRPPIVGRIDAILASARNRGEARRTVIAMVAVVSLALVGVVGSLKRETPGARAHSQGAPPPSSSRFENASPNAPSATLEIVELRAEFWEIEETTYRARKTEIDQAVEGAAASYLQGLPGVTLLGAPMIVVRSRERGVIQLVKEFRYPVEFEPGHTEGMPVTPVAFQSVNLGLEFGFFTELIGKDVQINGLITLRDLSGFTVADDGMRVPSFSVTEANIFRRLAEEKPVGFLLPGLTVKGHVRDGTFEKTLSAQPAPSSKNDASTPTRIAVFLLARAKVVPFPGKRTPLSSAGRQKATPDSSPRPAAVTPEKTAAIPHGIPVAGKPGFVISPHAPEEGYVDLRGFPPGSEVKDPYSGKIFLVP